MVSWFKRPGDSNIPKRKEQLLQRYLLTCHRSELEPKRKKDDEPVVTDDMDRAVPPSPVENQRNNEPAPAEPENQ